MLQAGNCPKCNSVNLEYDEADSDGEMQEYYYTCEDCNL